MTPPERLPADPPSAAGEESRAKPDAVVRTVLSSFFGVRKGDAMRRDLATINPLHLVVAAVLAGLAFVLALIVLVAFVTRHP